MLNLKFESSNLQNNVQEWTAESVCNCFFSISIHPVFHRISLCASRVLSVHDAPALWCVAQCYIALFAATVRAGKIFTPLASVLFGVLANTVVLPFVKANKARSFVSTLEVQSLVRACWYGSLLHFFFGVLLVRFF